MYMFETVLPLWKMQTLVCYFLVTFSEPESWGRKTEKPCSVFNRTVLWSFWYYNLKIKRSWARELGEDIASLLSKGDSGFPLGLVSEIQVCNLKGTLMPGIHALDLGALFRELRRELLVLVSCVFHHLPCPRFQIYSPPPCLSTAYYLTRKHLGDPFWCHGVHLTEEAWSESWGCKRVADPIRNWYSRASTTVPKDLVTVDGQWQ